MNFNNYPQMTKNQQFRHLKKNMKNSKESDQELSMQWSLDAAAMQKKYSKKLINILLHLKLYVKSAFAQYFHNAASMMTVSFGDKHTFIDKF